MTSAHGSANRLNLVDHIHAIDNLAEYSISPAFGGFGRVVKEGVIRNVDKKLS